MWRAPGRLLGFEQPGVDLTLHIRMPPFEVLEDFPSNNVHPCL
jgi:hypothetical protein